MKGKSALLIAAEALYLRTFKHAGAATGAA